MIRLTFSREPRPGDVIHGDVRIAEGPPPQLQAALDAALRHFERHLRL